MAGNILRKCYQYHHVIMPTSQTGKKQRDKETVRQRDKMIKGKKTKRQTHWQRPKNPYSALALLSGKFLRVRKVFARVIEIVN